MPTPAPLNRLIAAMAGEIDHYTNGLAGGQLSAAEWHNNIVQLLADGHTAAYLHGAGVDALDSAGRRLVLQAVADQAGYLGNLTDAVENGDLADAQIRARAAAYAGSVKVSYYRGAAPGLPFYPGEGCECNTNCKCSWQERNGEYWWMLGHVTTQHCATCRTRADGSPY